MAPQFRASFTDNAEVVIYDCNIFIVQGIVDASKRYWVEILLCQWARYDPNEEKFRNLG